MSREIWIWQNLLSPHMAALAAALAARGHQVNYIAQRVTHSDRVELGWTVPELGKANFVHCSDLQELEKCAGLAPEGAEHIFQGIRGNGYLSSAMKVLRRRGIPVWIFLEDLDDRGIKGFLRRAYYRYMFMRKRVHLRGVLAVGERTRNWVAARGIPPNLIYPFGYFLKDTIPPLRDARGSGDTLKLLFVGQLIERKGLDLLLTALSYLPPSYQHPQLDIIGAGPDETELRDLAGRLGLTKTVRWLGVRPMDEIPNAMASADLFVLPSRFDGWGAVVTEALMAGTPVIATDRCGASAAVRASKTGEVVPAEDAIALSDAIVAQLARGPVPTQYRLQLARWANSFGAESGAEYLSKIFEAATNGTRQPEPPWISSPPPERRMYPRLR